MTPSSRLGILGGTFDPIHLGHLAVARTAAAALRLDSVTFVPSHHPPHRPSGPRASAYHRFAMIALSVMGEPGMAVSDLELQRPDVSYTASTLRALGARGLDRSQIFFILGADAFAEIATWKEYPAVLDLSHFVVVSRPAFPVSSLMESVPSLASRMCELPAGGLAELSHGETPRIYLVNGQTPEVSSTFIRERLGAGLPVSGLVAPAVESYIDRHSLYKGAGTRATPEAEGTTGHGRRLA
ncbi:MAG: nicotinate-nucleotide adenylyltransferase [Vicinamibacterales bacterium]